MGSQHYDVQWPRCRLLEPRLPMRCKYWASSCYNLQAWVLCQRYAWDNSKTMCFLLRTPKTKWNVWKKRILHPWLPMLYSLWWFSAPSCWVFSWMHCHELRKQKEIKSWWYFDSPTLWTQSWGGKFRCWIWRSYLRNCRNCRISCQSSWRGYQDRMITFIQFIKQYGNNIIFTIRNFPIVIIC